MYELKNFSEVQTRRALDEYLASNEIPCKCERCQADIMAWALNRLPPRYFVSLKGEVITCFEAQMIPDKARVLAEIVAAVQIVSTHPSHPIND
ncbi:MAG: late competence development ComFB family protein [Desulfitobacteriia bacterium]|jgi:competence protein ComFB